MDQHFKTLRKEYGRDALLEATSSLNPFEQFKTWLEQAASANLIEPNAMALATVGADLRPSLRMVLLKSYDSSGFIFYTNYESRKGLELAHNQHASLLFYWAEFERQIRIEGSISKVARKQSEEYFASRPRGAQLAAQTSQQSREVLDRAALENRYIELEQKFADKEVPCPQHWGGYKLSALSFEFWQGRENKLHDRLRYVLGSGSTWTRKRLAP